MSLKNQLTESSAIILCESHQLCQPPSAQTEKEPICLLTQRKNPIYNQFSKVTTGSHHHKILYKLGWGLFWEGDQFMLGKQGYSDTYLPVYRVTAWWLLVMCVEQVSSQLWFKPSHGVEPTTSNQSQAQVGQPYAPPSTGTSTSCTTSIVRSVAGTSSSVSSKHVRVVATGQCLSISCVAMTTSMSWSQVCGGSGMSLTGMWTSLRPCQMRACCIASLSSSKGIHRSFLKCQLTLPLPCLICAKPLRV